MLKNRAALLKSRRYHLEPGDGTAYEFSLTECIGHNDAISGVGNGSEYVTLTLHSPGIGSYEIRKDSLKRIAKHTLLYLRPHFNASYYTLAFVLLAASVLVESLADLDGACAKLSEVPDVLYDIP